MRQLLTAALAVFALASSPALADEVTYSVRVHISPGELQNEAGVAAVYRRVNSAATDVCLHIEPLGQERDQCRRRVIADAITEAHVAELTQYYEARLPNAASQQQLAAR